MFDYESETSYIFGQVTFCHLFCEAFYDLSQVEPTVSAFWDPTIKTAKFCHGIFST